MTQGRHQPSHALSRPEEHGTVLVLFALLFVGIFGLLGAVVDGGRLRVTRQQMDAGAECAALEGVRFRDTEGDAGRRYALDDCGRAPSRMNLPNSPVVR